MLRRTSATIFILALLAGLLTTTGAHAAPAIPAEPNIVDVAQDSNGLNDQGTGAGLGDTPGGVYFGGADFLEIWFTESDDKLHVNFHTTGNPSGGNYAYTWRVWANDDCQTFEGHFTGASNPTRAEDTAQIREWCDELDPVPGEVVVEELEDTTFITTISFPIGSHPAIADGATVVAPYGNSRMSNPALLVPVLDTTVAGTDHVVGSGGTGGGEQPKEEPKEEPKPKKKGCKKNADKGKKKGCNKGKAPKKPPAKGCAAYQPGEQGAEAETLVVKDEHTAEAPLEITIEQEAGLADDLIVGAYDGKAHTFRNLQVDSAAAEAGIYIRYEFPIYEDHDLYVNYPDGSEAAHVGGFNATPVGPFDGTGSGGHSEHGAEQIDGLRTADCAGYTVDFSNYLGEGGEYTVKVWLGEIQNDPAAPGGGG